MVTQKLGFLKWCRDHFPLPFCRDKLSLGVSHVDGATPWDDCPYAKGNANTFVRACAYRVFLASCVEINLGATLGACSALGVPRWLILLHLGLKTLQEIASLKYCFSPSSFGAIL